MGHSRSGAWAGCYFGNIRTCTVPWVFCASRKILKSALADGRIGIGSRRDIHPVATRPYLANPRPPLFVPKANFRSQKDKNRGATISRLANCLIVKVKTAAQTKFKTHAAIIKTLAHPTRLLILDELSRGERCVQALTKLVGSEMPTVSRHLSLLKSAGIIEDEKRGAQVFYSVRVPCVLEVFSCARAIENNRRGKLASDPV